MKNFSRSLFYFFSPFLLLLFACPSSASDTEKLADHFNNKAVPLNTGDDIDEIIELAGSRRLVLLGEASHGTTEFYEWRSEITRRLISEKDFSFVAVEGDWASIYRLNEYVKGLPGALSSAKRVLRSFERWPEWMWANRDIEELAEWMRDYNSNLPADQKIGFYGMDVYGQWEAMDDLLEYTRKYLPDHHEEISRSMQCFANYDRDEWTYARAVSGRGHPSCEDELRDVVEILNEYYVQLTDRDEKKFFRARQNAIVVKNAEDFFRLAITDNAGSWNSRATHMWETVRRLLSHYGDDSRGIVWAHNTHVGDSDATSMRYQDMINIGHLSRGELGPDEVFITGFGTFKGTVNAGSSWGSRMHRMRVPEGIQGSYENIFGQLTHEQFYLIFDEEDRTNPLLNQFRGHRAIGVVYNTAQDAGNYVPTILPRRYDAFIFIRETGPLQPVR